MILADIGCNAEHGQSQKGYIVSQAQDNLLVIGARSLIGRRMAEALSEAGWPQDRVAFTSRRPLSGRQGLLLDTAEPFAFMPGKSFAQVVICVPIWLISDVLMARLQVLGMTRMVVFSSTSRLTKAESDESAEREVVAKLAEGERGVSAFCDAHGIAWTILRPTLIYDEGRDENITRIAETIQKLGFFPVCGKASGLRQPVHARDLADAALQALTAKAAHNKSYNVSGGEDLTYRLMVERIFTAIGRKPVIISLPEWLWRVIFALLNTMSAKHALKRNVQMVLRMNKDLWFAHASATRDFGYDPQAFRPDFINSKPTS